MGPTEAVGRASRTLRYGAVAGPTPESTGTRSPRPATARWRRARPASRRPRRVPDAEGTWRRAGEAEEVEAAFPQSHSFVHLSMTTKLDSRTEGQVHILLLKV